MTNTERYLLLIVFLAITLPALAQDSLNVRRLYQQSQWEDAHGVVVQDTLAFVLSGYGLQMVDIADPAAPRATGDSRTSSLFHRPYSVLVNDSLVYVADEFGSLQVFNLRNPADPRDQNTFGTNGIIYNMVVSGDFIYAVGNGFQIISVHTPHYPLTVGSCELMNGHGVAVSSNYAFVGDMGYLRVIDISSPAHPALRRSYPLSAGRVNDIAKNDHFLYVAAGTAGLQIYDISNPESLTVVGSYNTPGNANGVVINGNYAGLTDGTSGLRVIEISNPAAPTEVGFNAPSGSANAIAISGDHVFITDSTNGLRIVNVSTPANPTESGIFHEPGYALNVVVNGSRAYLAAGQAGLKIFDIANPGAPVELGSLPTTTSSFSASIAVTDSYAFVADYSGLRIISVSDPAAPVEVGHDSIQASDVAISGNRACVIGGNMFRIVDISNPASP